MSASDVHQFCTFYLGDSMYGIDVLKVQEVIQYHETTEVPLAPSVIRGLMNLRGSIVSSVDLRKRFGMDPRPPELEGVNVVTQVGAGLVSLQADRIGDVVEVTDALYEPTPGTLTGEARRLIESVYKLAEGLLMVLNVDEVLNF